MKIKDSDIAALEACDISSGRSTEGYFPWEAKSLVKRGLLEDVRTEIVGGWREYHWYRTTEAGRRFYTERMVR